jgi:two-component system NtrC family sensor kinase
MCLISLLIPYRVGNFEYFQTYISWGTGRWMVNKTGELIPWRLRNGLKHLQSVPLLFKSNEETVVYLRLHSSFREYKPVGLSVALQPEARLYKTQYTTYHEGKGLRNDFINTLLVGLLVLIALYNFYNYALTRDKAYLYFALFLVCLCLGRLHNFWFLLTPEQPAVFYWGNRIFFWLTNVFFVQYIRQFLQTQTVIPRTDRWLIISLVIHILFVLVPGFINPWLTLGQSILVVGYGSALALELPSDIIAIAIIQLYRRRYAPVRLILPAITPVLLLWTVGDFYANTYTLFAILNNWPVSFSLLFLYGEFITIGWWAIGASGALTRRYNEVRKQLSEQALEKERLEKEREIERNKLVKTQKIELEKQVLERTAELNQSLEELKSTQAQLIQSENWLHSVNLPQALRMRYKTH